VRLSNTGMQCWGSGEYGQLGSGAYLARGISSDVRVTWQTNPYAARAAALYSGANYRCAILTDRRVACWGAQGANNKTSNHPTLTEAGIIDGITDAVDMYMGQHYACVLQRQGTTWCWGYLAAYENGLYYPPGMTVSTPIPQRMPNISDGIELGGGYSGDLCVIKAEQSAYCFVTNSWDALFKTRPTSGVSSDVGQLGAGYLHVCMVKHTQSAVWCWGNNTHKQLADTIAVNTSTSTPQQIPGLTTVQQMDVGSASSCVILSSGQVQCWGWGSELQGTATNISTPTNISFATTMKRISVANLSCGVKADGTVWCWGSPVPGETSAATSLTARQLLGITDAIDVSATSGSICILRRGGEVRCMGWRVMLGDGSQTDRGVLRAISEPWQANPNRGCDWVDSQGQRHVYESLSGKWTWTQARDMAAARTWRDNSGYLATIMSPEENRCVHQLFVKSVTNENWPGTNGWYASRRWLGGSDAESEGTWKWMTGPEQGVQFRENVPGFHYYQTGYSAFQTTTDGCKPDCAYNPTWDYLSMLYVNGTHTQRNQWNDEVASDNEVGAIVEYTTGAGETARTYTTTTDSQGNYRFDGLAPGVYTVQSTTHGTSSTQRVVIWPDQRDERVDFVNRSVTTSLRQTATAAAQPTQTPTSTVTVTPQATIASATTWEFDALSGNSAASSTSANTGATFFCGTNYHATLLCPLRQNENGISYVRLNNQYAMRSQIGVSETSNVVRIRFRSSPVYATPIGIYGVVALSKSGFDREIYIDRGRICSRLWRTSTIEIICTTWRYDDGAWHVLERSYGGTGMYHRLRVDNESVIGAFTSSDFTWDEAFEIGRLMAMTTSGTIDIDYVITAPAP
jgi:hypothetical protein